MKSDLLYALSKGRLKTAVSSFSGFYYFWFLRFLVSSVIGSVSEIPVRFPVSSSVSGQHVKDRGVWSGSIRSGCLWGPEEEKTRQAMFLPMVSPSFWHKID